MLLKTLLLLLCYIHGLNFECTLSNEVFSCQNTNIIDLYKEYFRDKWAKSLSSILEIKILNSNIPKIDYLYKLPQLGYIESLEFRNCQLTDVNNKAFYDFKHLKTLNLKHNLLETVSFVNYLSETLERLILSNNKIVYVDTNFSKWKNLKLLDLSFNRLTVLDFHAIKGVPEINFGYNDIKSVVPYQNRYLSELDFVKLNVSGNKLSAYDEHQFFVIIDWLDLSYNNLKINMKYSKNYLNLAYCQIITFSEKISVKFADLTAVDGIDKLKLISDHLILKDNRLGDLDDFKIDIRDFYDTAIRHLDLSNCSITSIPGEYFINIVDCSVLKLSLNNLNLIKKHTFKNSNIAVLDLSRSDIKILEMSSFKDSNFNSLKLDNNRISILIKAFDNVSAYEIDLSYNSIRRLTVAAFERLRDVRLLNLSHCLIKNIDFESLKPLNRLEYLDLSYNSIAVLDSNVFNALPVRNLMLKGNKITSIKSYAFSNLYNVLELDLSGLAIENIANNAFYNLSNVRKINLSNNNLQTVLANLFIETPGLNSLDFSGNPIKSLNKFSNKLNITELTLSFAGCIESDRISNFHVKILTVKDSRIDVIKNGSFKGLYGLTHIYFNESIIKSIESDALIELFNLEYLDAQNLFNTIEILNEGVFRDINNIRALDLSGTDLNSIDSKSFIGLYRVETLQLNRNDIDEIASGTFDDLHSLELLNLSSNRIRKLNPGCFSGLDSLKVLLLADNRLDTIETNVFVNLNDLQVLDLQKNYLKNLENDRFKGVPNLLELHLAKNKLETLKNGVFQYLPELRLLNLRDNNLGIFGSPQHLFKFGVLSNLKNLEVLDLTYNRFTTLNVKSTFMSLKRLREIYLDHNDLKNLDFEGLLKNCRDMEFVGISFNKWHCDYLGDVIELLYNKSVNYAPDYPMFEYDNIEGINCTDVCKYVWCEGHDIGIVQLQ